jgi:hypothetical protein
MKRSEIFYLLAVAVFAVAFAVIVFSDFSEVIARGSTDATFSPTAGEPRDVDLEHIQRLQRQRELSDKEADHYTR